MRRVIFIAAMAVAGVTALAQEKEDRTLLSQEQMNAIINEASGERALHHVLDQVPYQFVRPPSEYQGHFRESEAVAKLATEYGFTNVKIEDFPTGTTWQPVVGELWITSPRPEKIYDLHDIPESVASTNANVDITGDLINVGQGTAQDFEGKDVKGKFVLSTAPSGLGAVYNRAVAAGAIGALGISAIGAGDRAVDYPDQIVSTTVNAQPNTAAWALSPKKARQLETLLNRGQKVTIRSINKGEQVPNKQELVHAEIAGDGSTTQEVAIGGHLFEGYIKQGANDDNSGCALTLEVGRDLHQVDQGREAAAAQAHGELPVGPGDQRHPRLARRASRQGQGDHRRPQLRHGSASPHDEPQLLDHAADARHLPVLHQRRRRRA